MSAVWYEHIPNKQLDGRLVPLTTFLCQWEREAKMTMQVRLGDLVELRGQQCQIVDIDDNGDLVVRHCNFASVRSAESHRLRRVASASAMRRGAMRVRAVALRIRDCGLRGALA